MLKTELLSHFRVDTHKSPQIIYHKILCMLQTTKCKIFTAYIKSIIVHNLFSTELTSERDKKYLNSLYLHYVTTQFPPKVKMDDG